MTDFKPYFLTKRCSDLTDRQLSQCSELYSQNYGVYSGKDDHEKGARIKLSSKYYQRYREHPDMYVSLCYNKRTLLGQAFYLKKTLPSNKTCIWVTQLLVKEDYRKKGIATRLLQSAWGFSDYFAWGLATTNAVTVKTLESVTWRRVEPEVIAQNIDTIDRLCSNIEFVKGAEKIVSGDISQINSHFFPDFQLLENDLNEVYVERLGKIKDGFEWLAFTFQTQEMIFNQAKFDKWLDFSTSQIQDAYGRMKVANQRWASSTGHEVDQILQLCELTPGSHILDLGCGIGRHSIEFAARGFQVTGVDFSTRLIQKAQKTGKSKKNVRFIEADCRNLNLHEKYDLAVCLYDVIGSFRSYVENRKIAETIFKRLKDGGKAVISVMNMELTEAVATNKTSITANPTALLKLRASNIMQSTGDVFNPDYFLLDSETHLVYRKEQFECDGLLSSEYLIADYRFKRTEIVSMLEEIGFKILSSTYVSLNHWDNPLGPTDKRAKEILIVAERPNE